MRVSTTQAATANMYSFSRSLVNHFLLFVVSVACIAGKASADGFDFKDLLTFGVCSADEASAISEPETPNQISIYLADDTAENSVSVEGEDNFFDLYQAAESKATSEIIGDCNATSIYADVGALVALEVFGNHNLVALNVLSDNNVTGSVRGVGNSVIIGN